MARDPVSFTIEPISCDRFQVTIDSGSRLYFSLFSDWTWYIFEGVPIPVTLTEIESYTYIIDFSEIDIYVPPYPEFASGSLFRLYLNYYDEDTSSNVNNGYRDIPVIPRSLLHEDFGVAKVFYPKCWEWTTIETTPTLRWKVWLEIRQTVFTKVDGPSTTYSLPRMDDYDRGVIRRASGGEVYLAARKRTVGEPTLIDFFKHSGAKDSGEWERIDSMWDESVFWYDWLFLPAQGGAYSVALKYKASDSKFHWYCKRTDEYGAWPPDSEAIEITGIGARLTGLPFLLKHRDGIFYITASTIAASEGLFSFLSLNGGTHYQSGL